jgi:hypothetical protein
VRNRPGATETARSAARAQSLLPYTHSVRRAPHTICAKRACLRKVLNAGPGALGAPPPLSPKYPSLGGRSTSAKAYAARERSTP